MTWFSYYQFPDAYTQTKAEAEKLVMTANERNGLVTCCIRPGSIFGPGDTILPILVSYGGMMVSACILHVIYNNENNKCLNKKN